MAPTTQKGRPVRGRRRRGRKRPRTPTNGPVPLHRRSSSHFKPSERQLGEESFRADGVKLDVRGTRARALVEGADGPRRVGVDWERVAEERRLHVFCECPRFTGGSPCQHVWAALLALAETGDENQPPGKDRLGVRKDRAATWTELGISEEEIEAERQRAPRIHLARPSRHSSRSTSSSRATPGGTWRSQLASLGDEIVQLSVPAAPVASSRTRAAPEILFLVNVSASGGESGLVLDVFGRGRTAAGEPGKLKRTNLEPERLEQLLLPKRRPGEAPGETPELALLSALPIDRPAPRSKARGRGRGRKAKPQPEGIRRFRLPPKLYDSVLPYLCSQRALSWWDGRTVGDPQPLSWKAGPSWQLGLRLEVAPRGGARLRGELVRKKKQVPLSDVLLVLSTALESGNGGKPAMGNGAGHGPALVLFAESIGRLDSSRSGDLAWISLLRGTGDIAIPKAELGEAVSELMEFPALPKLELPDELQLEADDVEPKPRLVLEPPAAGALIDSPLLAELSFDYGDLRVSADDPRPAVADWDEQKYLQRDMESEHTALVRLLELGVRPIEASNGQALELAQDALPAVAEPLLAEGWAVEVNGVTMRPPSPPALRVESGIDWFEVDGEVDFAGDQVKLSSVLDAVARGERYVELQDGSKGLLPESWLETYDSLSKLAQSSDEDGLRFLSSQALLVDALLAAMPPAQVDPAFAKLREKLSTFESIKPKRELKSFVGELRPYQRDGLGWLSFLREFGLGGVLADDMGLGKTVQLLALLQTYRTASKTTKLPWLVVAPRSLVYNWLDEAARFTPKLKVIEYGGSGREALREKLADYDMVVTTYGTLRNDIGYLSKFEFDTAVLDEAQAIKNPTSQTAKASRLLVARHRLALTGTPIENHLGELGSLFEFLNPGLLGRLPWLDVLGSGLTASQQELALVAQGIRPFILRRTKEQVLPDLPPKTEQVLHCTLREEQRELYDRLRAEYQATLLKQVEVEGMSGAGFQVLQALLRLRQVACHPGLVDPTWKEAGSAKLEALHAQVAEVLEEGHKVIVFSQFTKLLGFVREHMDGEGVEYAYLDGQTRNRGEVVERFQTDPNCNLFLISLKAGGLGLNLTAAGYVFLLDPWWNPAVEAQAIDRAHRIGQTQPVFAYRMIAQDTVEEKIVELQRSKRQLADSILEGEGQTVGDLSADDLKMLLS